MMFVDGTRHASELEFTNCECPVCTQHSPEDLKRDERALAEHNLYVSFAEMGRIRQAIKAGDLLELAGRPCPPHPPPLDGLTEHPRPAQWLGRFQPFTHTSPLFHRGPMTQ